MKAVGGCVLEPSLVQLGGRRAAQIAGLGIGVQPAPIELEAVHADLLLQGVELFVQQGPGGGLAQVQGGAVAVPPGEQHGLPVCAAQQGAGQGLGLAEAGAVGGKIGHQPDHHRKAQVVQLPAHGLGVREAAGMEAPKAVVLLPGVVDHQHAGGQAVGQHGPGIGQHALLVLLVEQLHPGVVLGPGVEQGLGGRWVEGKVGLHGGQIGLAQAAAGGLELQGRAGGLGAQHAGRKADGKPLVAPKVAALGGKEERHGLVAALFLAQVDGVIAAGGQGHAGAVVHGAAPPALPGKEAGL